ncbi:MULTISPECIES: acyl-CoA dehydrogenase family protein [Polaromonas]|uniref:Acyl-CoA dehydrogenase family protein n=1 Tax=Polaromonas aquatica TaxID=332657 RepID=A0ABW1U0Q7_9BURK
MKLHEYEEFRHQVRRLAQEKIRPHAGVVDEESRLPRDSIDAFRAMALNGLPFPEALGGAGGDLMSQVIAVEEVARVCGSSSLVLLIPWAALTPLVWFGSEELKQEIVPAVAAGQCGASFCLTEPGGGSDLRGIRTRAERVAGGWRINGQKRFISNVGWSDWYAVLARVSDNAFGVFMLHCDAPGFRIGRHERKMGMRGSPTADLIFEDCMVPEHRVVGDPERGHDYMIQTLTYTRPLVSAQALGLAQGALDEAVTYTAGRDQFGTRVSRFQMVRGMVADMAIAVESARALLYRTVEIAGESNDGRARGFASMAKTLCSDTAMKVTTDAVQLHGGYGYMKDYAVERMMRDAKVSQIWEGTNQIQRLLVAKYVYDEPGSGRARV